ncbi:MAG: tetratricopeptide repeat protein [Caldilineales bacterium]|nr:tetratricopeptide repeat protein [Caldilineales bacterium]
MHPLVPQFILRNYADGRLQGGFEAVSLFVDLSGFTAMADALMEHGHHGAEVLTEVLRAVFDPLVEIVHVQGGFTVGFAGDAFTALFPLSEAESETECAQRALAAAWQIQGLMATTLHHETPYGSHVISAKAGLARGAVNWGIFESEDARRAAYYFRGDAIDGCAEAEHHAQAGDIVIAPSLLDSVAGLMELEPLDEGFHRLLDLEFTQPEPFPLPQTIRDFTLESRFFPANVIEQETSGEFRHVVNVFLSLPTLRTEEQLRSFVYSVYRAQEQYGGFIERLDFGDKGCNMLMFWGTPTSHENDILRALNFVLDVQKDCVAPVSVGVTYRLAHAGFTGSRLHEGYTCYGRGVSLAARMMMAAPIGSVWMDEEVYARASTFFNCEYVGEQHFKGFATPQTAYRLLERAEWIGPTLYQGRLIGREQELEALRRFVQPLRERLCAGTLIIWGEAGIGKSRLLHSFRHSDFFEDFSVHWARCQADQVLRQSFNPFRYWLSAFFELPAHADMHIRRSQFDGQIDELVAWVVSESTHPYAELLAEEMDRTRSFLGALFNLEWPDSPYARLGPRERHDNTVVALSTFIQALSLQKPIIVQLEDAHWLDEDSLQLWRLLARQAALGGETAAPLAVIATARPQEGIVLLSDEVEFESLYLAELSADDFSRLAQSALGGPVTPAVIDTLIGRAEGNPFFAEQLLSLLRETNLLVQTENGWDLRQPADATPLPTDVWSVLAARIDRLPFEVRDVVQTAAVLGREFETPLLGEIRHDDLLDSKIAEAERATIWTALARMRYLFQHALLRDAAYEMLIHARRRILHGLAARAIERLYGDELPAHYAELARHFGLAGHAEQERQYVCLAAEQAASQYANAEAIRLYTRALELTPAIDLRERFDLISARERVYDLIGDRSAQSDDLAELARLADAMADEQLNLQISLRRADLGHLTADYESALAQIGQAETLARMSDDESGLAEAFSLHGRILFRMGDYDRASQQTETALALARQHGIEKEVARCLYLIAHIHLSQGRREQARNHYREAQTVYQRLHDQRGEMNCLMMFGSIERQFGHYSYALDYHGRALDLCRTLGWRLGETIILQHMGNSFFDLGVYEQAESHHRRALRIAREIGDQEGEANSLDTLGLILHFSGQNQDALVYHQDALEIQQATNYRRGLGYTLTHLGLALAEMGEWERARQAFSEALALRQSLNPEDGAIIDDLAGLALAAWQAGDAAQANRLSAQALDWLQTNGVEGVEFPVQAYLICYRILAGRNDQKENQRRAHEALAVGYALIQERVAHIERADERRAFLEDVPAHRELLVAFHDHRSSKFQVEG